MPDAFAVSIKLKVTALFLAPLGVFANRKFFLSITKGFILRSARYIGTLPDEELARVKDALKIQLALV